MTRGVWILDRASTGSRLHLPNLHWEGVCGKYETKRQGDGQKEWCSAGRTVMNRECMPVWCVCTKLCGGWLWSLRKGCWLGPMQTSLLGRGVDSIAERQHCPSVGPLFNLLQSKHWLQRLNGWEGALEGPQRGYMRGKRKLRRKIPQRDACFTYLVNFITYPPALNFPPESQSCQTEVLWWGLCAFGLKSGCGMVKEWGCADGHQVKRRAACFNAHGSVLDPLAWSSAWSDLRRYVCRGLCFCSICWNQIQQTASKI